MKRGHWFWPGHGMQHDVQHQMSVQPVARSCFLYADLARLFQPVATIRTALLNFRLGRRRPAGHFDYLIFQLTPSMPDINEGAQPADRTYRTEFPDFGDLDIALPDGFRDISRRVDRMPSFALTLSAPDTMPVTEVILFIDSADPFQRKQEETPRFTMLVMQDHTELLASFESDDYAEILSSIDIVASEYRRQAAAAGPSHA